MTITKEELEQYRYTLSTERLQSFIQNETDTLDIILERYKNNIRISQALYPELSILEVTLRNAINSTLCKHISETWLEDEIKQQKFLFTHEYSKLVKAYNDTQQEYKPQDFTIGKVIANLNFGFWTGLCSKKYNSEIWNKGRCFQGIFPNYPTGKQQISNFSKKLNSIRSLRNRIFHHEPIFKYPQNLLNKYNEILEMLNYLPHGNSTILKDTTTFLNTYNQCMEKQKQQKT